MKKNALQVGTVLLGMGLVLIWGLALGLPGPFGIAGTPGTSVALGWVTWLDLAAALCAFATAFALGRLKRQSVRADELFALGAGLWVLWLVAITTHLVPWLAWGNFGLGCAFLLLGLSERPALHLPSSGVGAAAPYQRHPVRPLPGSQYPYLGAEGWAFDDGMPLMGPYLGRGPAGYQRADERILEEINDGLTWHANIDASAVEVQVQDGEVTLLGFVDTRRQRRLAEALAEGVLGVRSVHNKLQVRGLLWKSPTSGPGKAA